ncbi:MAG: PfkB family carbohydrate kinase [Streptosporangiaceae bacterium]|jgi:ribokinase
MEGRPRLTVLGSLNMDISVAVERLPAPGETVLGPAAVIAPGGKGANQAVAAARLGAAVRMAGCTGADDFGGALVAALAAEGVDVGAVRAVAGYATGMALITVDAMGENVITVAAGANGQAGSAEAEAALGSACDLLIVSAEIPVAVVAAVLTGARAAGTPCLLNLAPAPRDAAGLLSGGVDWLVVNESEAAAILGRPVAGMTGALTAAGDLRRLGARNAVVTAGANGAALASDDGAAPGGGGAAPGGLGAAPGRGQPDRAGLVAVAGLSVRSVDAVGAGDAFVAALGVTLAAGLPAVQAARAAGAAGATATTRHGTQDALPRPGDIFAATGLAWPLAPR